MGKQTSLHAHKSSEVCRTRRSASLPNGLVGPSFTLALLRKRVATKTRLPFRELEPLTGAWLSRFLTFPHSRITGEEAFFLQRGSHGHILL